MPWIDKVAAVIFAGLPGQESGNSLVDTLYGDINPSGRLVFTVAKQISDYPAQVLYQSSDPHPPVRIFFEFFNRNFIVIFFFDFLIVFLLTFFLSLFGFFFFSFLILFFYFF